MRTTTNSRMAGLLSASALAIGLVAIVQPAAAGISATKHNLGSTGGTNYVSSNDTGEICVFCHTPHGSNTTVTAPLWNKTSTLAASSYLSYNGTNSATFDATQNGPGSISLACLTCHDGTQAMDNMVNASGFGGFTSASSASGASYTWSGARAAADGRLINSGNFQSVLGSDLTNDHPVGMNYCAAADNANIATPSTSCNDKDFNTGVGGVAARAWIDTGTAGYQKSDLPLYGTSAGSIRVECATCHDPHLDFATSGTLTFLRISNTGSAVCLACHAK